MRPLGPFGPAPRLVAGVSGGPDSLALAVLADAWARARGGALLPVICDHGLRAESAGEAAGVAAMLRGRGMSPRIVPLRLSPGAGAQARARAARHAALLAVCAEAGAPWLLLGHHRGDQAETLLLRALAGSGPSGLAAMAEARAAPAALVLRPLLGIAKARLEATVAGAGLRAVHDPSNADSRFTRVALRPAAARAGDALAEAAFRFAARRARLEEAVARRMAGAATLHELGFARLDLPALGRDRVAVAALRRLVQAIGGAGFPPAEEATRALLARGEGCLAGAVLRRDGLLAREGAALAPPVPAVPGATWDGRFRLATCDEAGCELGAAGAEAAGLPRPAWLPAAVAATLPALRRNMVLVAVPGLAYPAPDAAARFRLLFRPLAGPAA
jgi:tRNA(Ile)-lysidine synthase